MRAKKRELKQKKINTGLMERLGSYLLHYPIEVFFAELNQISPDQQSHVLMAQGNESQSILHYAAQSCFANFSKVLNELKNRNILSFLINKGDILGSTPLAKLFDEEPSTIEFEKFKRLLDEGANPEVMVLDEKNSRFPLCECFLNKDNSFDLIKYWLKINPDILNKKFTIQYDSILGNGKKQKRTTEGNLLFWVLAHSTEITPDTRNLIQYLLLEEEKLVFEKDSNKGETPLFHILAKGEVAVVKSILSRHALEENELILHFTNKAFQTALFAFAILHGQNPSLETLKLFQEIIDLAPYLLKKNSGEPILYLLMLGRVDRSFFDCAKDSILKYFPEENIESFMLTSEGFTPFHYAYLNKNNALLMDICRTYPEYINLYSKEKNHKTLPVFLEIAQTGQLEILKELAKFESVNWWIKPHYLNVLHCAAISNKPKVLMYVYNQLLKRGGTFSLQSDFSDSGQYRLVKKMTHPDGKEINFVTWMALKNSSCAQEQLPKIKEWLSSLTSLEVSQRDFPRFLINHSFDHFINCLGWEKSESETMPVSYQPSFFPKETTPKIKKHREKQLPLSPKMTIQISHKELPRSLILNLSDEYSAFLNTENIYMEEISKMQNTYFCYDETALRADPNHSDEDIDDLIIAIKNKKLTWLKSVTPLKDMKAVIHWKDQIVETEDLFEIRVGPKGHQESSKKSRLIAYKLPAYEPDKEERTLQLITGFYWEPQGFHQGFVEKTYDVYLELEPKTGMLLKK